MTYSRFNEQITSLWRGGVIISLSVLAAGLLGGCAHSHPIGSSYNQRLQQITKPITYGQWLPIHTEGCAIVGIGTYLLPQKIVCPAGLTPTHLGLALFDLAHPGIHPLIALQVFFKPTDEKTVFDWARTGNFSPGSEPGYWSSKHEHYLVPATDNRLNGTIKPDYVWSSHFPSEMPLSWRIYGGFDTKRWTYAVTWSGMPIGKNGGDYGPNSPVAGQKRLVSLLVIFQEHHLLQWLPIRFSNHRITAVGQHVLSRPITIPAELKPFAKAQAYFHEGASQGLSRIVIYFPEVEEKAVMKWAQSYPIIVEAGSGAIWTNKGHIFESALVNDNSYLELCEPDSPSLLAWHIYGTFTIDSVPYGIGWNGMSVVTAADLKNNPRAQIFLNGDAADYTGPGSDFEPSSPLPQEKRHVKLSIGF